MLHAYKWHIHLAISSHHIVYIILCICVQMHFICNVYNKTIIHIFHFIDK
jgi:hypothetical protein